MLQFARLMFKLISAYSQIFNEAARFQLLISKVGLKLEIKIIEKD